MGQVAELARADQRSARPARDFRSLRDSGSLRTAPNGRNSRTWRPGCSSRRRLGCSCTPRRNRCSAHTRPIRSNPWARRGPWACNSSTARSSSSRSHSHSSSVSCTGPTQHRPTARPLRLPAVQSSPVFASLDSFVEKQTPRPSGKRPGRLRDFPQPPTFLPNAQSARLAKN